MKKFLFFAIATAMLGLTFTSCDKDNEEENNSNVKVSLDGRWDGAPKGFPYAQQNMTLIFKGNQVDVYILAWGDHLKGTYKYENDSLSFSFKLEDALDARKYTDEQSWGWNFGDGALNPETLELSEPYDWYPMSESDFEGDKAYLSEFSFKLIDEKTAESGGSNPQMVLEFKKK